MRNVIVPPSCTRHHKGAVATPASGLQRKQYWPHTSLNTIQNCIKLITGGHRIRWSIFSINILVFLISSPISAGAPRITMQLTALPIMVIPAMIPAIASGTVNKPIKG